LGSLGGSGRGVGNIAFSINNKGQVVGNSDLPGDTTGHGFLWEKGKMQDLGTLPGDVVSAALFINDSGEVAGVSLDGEGAPRATRWFNGAVEDLNDLVPADAPLYLLFACGINAGGQIVGQAADKMTGEPHGFLLTPSAQPPSGSSITPALRRLPRKPVAPRFNAEKE
jgi:probable HAF family extracellular repeat protein